MVEREWSCARPIIVEPKGSSGTYSEHGGGAHVYETKGDRSSPAPRPVVKWRAPDEGWIKINLDGSFRSNTRYGVGAVVIRNHEGTVLAACSMWYGLV